VGVSESRLLNKSTVNFLLYINLHTTTTTATQASPKMQQLYTQTATELFTCLIVMNTLKLDIESL